MGRGTHDLKRFWKQRHGGPSGLMVWNGWTYRNGGAGGTLD